MTLDCLFPYSLIAHAGKETLLAGSLFNCRGLQKPSKEISMDWHCHWSNCHHRISWDSRAGYCFPSYSRSPGFTASRKLKLLTDDHLHSSGYTSNVQLILIQSSVIVAISLAVWSNLEVFVYIAQGHH